MHFISYTYDLIIERKIAYKAQSFTRSQILQKKAKIFVEKI